MRTVHRDRVRFYEGLAQLVGASVPVLAALRVVEQGEGRTRLGWAALRVGDRIRRRRATLAESLAERSELFGSWQIEQVRLGESSGRLAQHLAFLAGEERESVGYLAGIWSRLLPPVFFLQIVPIILALPEGLRSGWAAFGESVIPLWLQLNGAILLVPLLAGVLAWLGRRSTLVAGALGLLPGVGSVRRDRAAVRYARGLSEALSSGASKEVAFELARTAVDDPAFAARVAAIEEKSVSGQASGGVLASAGLFHPGCRKPLAELATEEDLPDVLVEVADCLRDRFRRATKRGVILVSVLVYGGVFLWLLSRIVRVLTQDLTLP